MAPFEDFLTQATTPGPGRLLPGCAFVVAGANGIKYAKCFGTESIDPSSPLLNKPFSLDTTMWIASCTKLMTAICALQCVEKGLLNLDDDISTVLSEWKDPKILMGFDKSTGEPILEPAKKIPTLRMLLTHQSGFGYPFVNPGLQQYTNYKKSKGEGESQLVRDAYFLPLIFEPGTSWEYGVGLDWTGQMVERVTKQTLNDYMREHIWEPLGMKSTTFRLRERPDISERRADISKRAEDGTLIPMIERVVGNDTPDDRGGGGLHSSTGDYVKLLIALLKNDGTLMKPETVDALLFEPCLSSAAREALQANRTAGHKKDQEDPMLMNGMEVAGRVDYAPAGLVELDSKPGGRSENSVGWGGYPNLTWVMDRKSGIIFFSGTQIIPPGDRIKKKAFAMFETAIYSGELGPLTS